MGWRKSRIEREIGCGTEGIGAAFLIRKKEKLMLVCSPEAAEPHTQQWLVEIVASVGGDVKNVSIPLEYRKKER